MKRVFPLGSTSIMVTIALRDSTTGQLKTGVAFGSVSYSYWRDGASSGATGTCVTATKGTYADHGWIETDYAGLYQFGIPDACLAAGANGVSIKLSVSGAIDVVINIQLMSATQGLAGTSLPPYAAGAKGGLPVTDAGTGLKLTGYGGGEMETLVSVGTSAGQINVSSGVVPASGDWNTATPPTVQNIVDGIDATVPSGKTYAFGARIPDKLAGAASGLATVGSAMGLAGGSIVTATFGTCVPPAPSGMATSTTQTSILNAVNAVTTNTARSMPVVPNWLVRPSSDSTTYQVMLYLYKLQGALEDPDNGVTIHARTAAGTSRDVNLSDTNMSRSAAGTFFVNYTVASTHAAEAIYFDFTWAVGSVAMADSGATEVQDAENLATLADVQTKTSAIYNWLPSHTPAVDSDGKVAANNLPSDYATASDVSALQTHGDTNWATATGFALASVWTPTKAGYLDTAISSRHHQGDAVAKSAASLDWLHDVDNKPTIGTSTVTTADVLTQVGDALTGYDDDGGVAKQATLRALSIPSLADIRKADLFTGAFPEGVYADQPAVAATISDETVAAIIEGVAAGVEAAGVTISSEAEGAIADSVVAKLGSRPVTINSPLTRSGRLTLYSGDTASIPIGGLASVDTEGSVPHLQIARACDEDAILVDLVGEYTGAASAAFAQTAAASVPLGERGSDGYLYRVVAIWPNGGQAHLAGPGPAAVLW